MSDKTTTSPRRSKPKKKGRKPAEEQAVYTCKDFKISATPHGYTLVLKKGGSGAYYYTGALQLFKGLLRHCTRGEIAASGLSDINNYILVTERAVDKAEKAMKTLIGLKLAE